MGPFAFRLFGRSRAEQDADRLFAVVTAVARRPSFYGEGRVPDSFDGRFEVLVAVAALALMRLKAEPKGARLAQEFTDRLFLGLDDSLREVGVGDLSVPKQMKALARRVYGRVQAFGEALASDAPADALSQALARNVWAEAAPPFAVTLAAWMGAAHAAFAEAPIERLFEGAAWPEVRGGAD